MNRAHSERGADGDDEGAVSEGAAAVTVADLRHSFGDVRALDGVSFTVEAGEIFGLVGPNGAGKTTTLRILATLLSPDGGTASVFGTDVAAAPNAVREQVRYLPAEAGAYENMTGRDYLEFVAGFYAEGAADVASVVDRAVAMADLGDRIDDKTGEYSTGMTRKLLVASALMTEPPLAILDEVTTGLDVRNARRVRDAIKEYPDGAGEQHPDGAGEQHPDGVGEQHPDGVGEQHPDGAGDESPPGTGADGTGRSVLLSSHDMLEVSYLCDRVALIDEGSIVDVGTPAELVAAYDAENLEDAFLEATK